MKLGERTLCAHPSFRTPRTPKKLSLSFVKSWPQRPAVQMWPKRSSLMSARLWPRLKPTGTVGEQWLRSWLIVRAAAGGHGESHRPLRTSAWSPFLPLDATAMLDKRNVFGDFPCPDRWSEPIAAAEPPVQPCWQPLAAASLTAALPEHGVSHQRFLRWSAVAYRRFPWLRRTGSWWTRLLHADRAWSRLWN